MFVLSCWESTSGTIEDLNAQCDIKKSNSIQSVLTFSNNLNFKPTQSPRMLSILLNNAGKCLEAVRTWRMRPLLMLPSKDDFYILVCYLWRYLTWEVMISISLCGTNFVVLQYLFSDAGQIQAMWPASTTLCTRPMSCLITPVTSCQMS